MRSRDVIQLAVMSVRRNKLRSTLTALGVTVGVFALTTIIALGGGLEQAIIEQLTDDESQTRIVVRPGFGKRPDHREHVVEGVDDPAKVDRLKKAMAKRRRGGPAQMRRKQLTPETLEAIAALDHVVEIRPLAIDRFKMKLGEHELDGALSFGIPADSKRWEARIIAGAPFPSDARGVYLHEYLLYRWGYRNDREQAALVGATVTLSRPRAMAGIGSLLSAAQTYGGVDVQVDPKKVEQMAKLFGIGNGGGQGKDGKGPVLAREVPILGVIRERVEADGFEVWEDSFSMQADVFLPQRFAEELFLQVPSNVSRGYNAASLEVSSPTHVKAVEDHLREEGYRTVSIGTILERLGQAMAMITAVVSGLTAIALIVALLGIVNTMVMNVSERTREIGVFKALGATDRQVRALFLVESGLIGLAGGVSGVALALLSSIPGNYLTRKAIFEISQYRYDGSIFHFPLWLIGLAMLFAVGLSVLAALGPATRASRTNPVTALRDE